MNSRSQSAISKLSSSSSIHSTDDPITRLTKSIIQDKKHKLSLAIAGGGSKAISALASTPGASSVLLNGSILYSRQSFCQYLSNHLVLGPQQEDSNNSSSISYKNHQNQFGFASSGAAVLLSKAALHHSFQQSSLQEMNVNLAIGCTSTLVSHGREERCSRVHIALMKCNGSGIVCDIKLSNGGQGAGDHEDDDGSATEPETERRSRLEEEELLAQLILSSIQQFDEEMAHGDILQRQGDQWNITKFTAPDYNINGGIFVQNAAQKVIDDANTDAVIITLRELQDDAQMVPLAYTVIPSDPIIIPGSFNPPHMGHVSLAQAAVKTMTRKKQQELEGYFTTTTRTPDQDGDENDNDNVMENMWNTTEYQSFKSLTEDTFEQGPFSVLFEMSLTNADKPPMETSEASRRVSLFGELTTQEEITMPKDWGVLLTSAPLFIDKVRLFKKYLAPSGATFLPGSSKRLMTFVIGTDTMVRIINPKYYSNAYENMIEAVREMGEEGVHFVVGGRLEQVKSDEGAEKVEVKVEAKFVTGEEELEGLPLDVRNMFTIIREEDFRVDISSTELRAVNHQKIY